MDGGQWTLLIMLSNKLCSDFPMILGTSENILQEVWQVGGGGGGVASGGRWWWGGKWGEGVAGRKNTCREQFVPYDNNSTRKYICLLLMFIHAQPMMCLLRMCIHMCLLLMHIHTYSTHAHTFCTCEIHPGMSSNDFLSVTSNTNAMPCMWMNERARYVFSDPTLYYHGSPVVRSCDGVKPFLSSRIPIRKATAYPTKGGGGGVDRKVTKFEA